jgi:hypothetical protein
MKLEGTPKQNKTKLKTLNTGYYYLFGEDDWECLGRNPKPKAQTICDGFFCKLVTKISFLCL